MKRRFTAVSFLFLPLFLFLSQAVYNIVEVVSSGANSWERGRSPTGPERHTRAHGSWERQRKRLDPIGRSVYSFIFF
jgi:hypothetical protein